MNTKMFGSASQSEKSKRLVGYVQVYDMSGMNWRHYSSREIAEKLKAALQTGGFYVEAVSHMFVINSSTLFAAAWGVAWSDGWEIWKGSTGARAIVCLHEEFLAPRSSC